MLTQFADWFTYVLLRMSQGTLLSGAVHFFVYDIIKIYLLLVVVVFLIFLVQTWLSAEKIKRILMHRNEAFNNVLTSLLGAIAPFCSCSSVPLFIGFVESGVPLGVTTSFLVASPMITPQASCCCGACSAPKLHCSMSRVGWSLPSRPDGLSVACISRDG